MEEASPRRRAEAAVAAAIGIRRVGAADGGCGGAVAGVVRAHPPLGLELLALACELLVVPHERVDGARSAAVDGKLQHI